MRVIAYLRVSTDEQATGIEAQRAAIREEIERRDWPEPEWVIDEGFSGGNTRRPGLRAALDALAEGRADALVVSRMDRLSRSLPDWVRIMERARQEGWALNALDCPADPETPTGEALASMMATFAQLERRMIGQRIKEALAVKRAQGVRLGRPRTLPAKVVRRIVREREAGRSLREIAAGLTADGVPTAHGGRWAAETIRGVVRSAEIERERAETLAAAS